MIAAAAETRIGTCSAYEDMAMLHQEIIVQTMEAGDMVAPAAVRTTNMFKSGLRTVHVINACGRLSVSHVLAG